MNIELEYRAETLEKAKKHLSNRIVDIRYENKVIALKKWIESGILWNECPEPEVSRLEKDPELALRMLCDQIESSAFGMGVRAFFSIEPSVRPQGLPLVLQATS